MSKILIVDDEPDLVKIFEARLKAKGYSTLKASNGAEAIELVKQGGIYLIFMDYYLPDMNGLEVCKRIREELKNETPLIFISASAEIIDSLPDLPKTEKLVKPISSEMLLSLAEKYLPK